MINPMRAILSVFKRVLHKKAYLYIPLVAMFCLSCSYDGHFSKEVPKKIKYSKATFTSCNNDQNIGYLCLTEANAINMTLDLKKCQEQNSLLRELLGN